MKRLLRHKGRWNIYYAPQITVYIQDKNISHVLSRNFVLTNTDRDKHAINFARVQPCGLTDVGDRKHKEILNKAVMSR
jgi:hypothetical protein